MPRGLFRCCCAAANGKSFTTCFMSPLSRVLEALLFASDKPMSPAECVKHLKGAVDAAPEDVDVAALAKSKPDEVSFAMGELASGYE